LGYDGHSYRSHPAKPLHPPRASLTNPRSPINRRKQQKKWPEQLKASWGARSIGRASGDGDHAILGIGHRVHVMAAGCAKVYQEKVSGARADRAELAKVLKRIEPGDLLIVTRLDRLARSTRDLLNILHAIADREAKFKSLHDPWCDTSTPQGELLVTVLAGFAQFERRLIKARTDGSGKRQSTAWHTAKHWSTLHVHSASIPQRSGGCNSRSDHANPGIGRVVGDS
jgi:hypothetical protein